MSGNYSPLLINEEPLQVLPSLAVNIGLNQAIVLQQVHFWLRTNQKNQNVRNYRDGRWWSYNSIADWQKTNFPFWSGSTVRRAFEDLERRGLLISDKKGKSHMDQKKWYTIDYEALDRVFTGETPAGDESGGASGEGDGAQTDEQIDLLNLNKSGEPPDSVNMSESIRSEWANGLGQSEQMFFNRESNRESNRDTPPDGGAGSLSAEEILGVTPRPEQPRVKRTADEIRAGIVGAIQAFEERGGPDVSRFPEELRPYAEAFVKSWRVEVPEKGGTFGFWLNGLKELRAACGEFGPSLVVEFFNRWSEQMKASPTNDPPFSVGHPRAVVKSVSALAGEKRLKGQSPKVETVQAGGFSLPSDPVQAGQALAVLAGENWEQYIEVSKALYIERRDFWNLARQGLGFSLAERTRKALQVYAQEADRKATIEAVKAGKMAAAVLASLPGGPLREDERRAYGL